jgi:hypothetical protein
MTQNEPYARLYAQEAAGRITGNHSPRQNSCRVAASVGVKKLHSTATTRTGKAQARVERENGSSVNGVRRSARGVVGGEYTCNEYGVSKNGTGSEIASV